MQASILSSFYKILTDVYPVKLEIVNLSGQLFMIIVPFCSFMISIPLYRYTSLKTGVY